MWFSSTAAVWKEIFLCWIVFDYAGHWHIMLSYFYRWTITLPLHVIYNFRLTISNSIKRQDFSNKPACRVENGAQNVGPGPVCQPESFQASWNLSCSPPPPTKPCFPSNLDHMPLIVYNLLRAEIYVLSLERRGPGIFWKSEQSKCLLCIWMRNPPNKTPMASIQT